MSFPQIQVDLRTDYNFRNPNEANEAEMLHHKEYSILQQLPIDMIDCFVVSDPLHLLELGIMKKYALKRFFSKYKMIIHYVYVCFKVFVGLERWRHKRFR